MPSRNSPHGLKVRAYADRSGWLPKFYRAPYRGRRPIPGNRLPSPEA